MFLMFHIKKYRSTYATPSVMRYPPRLQLAWPPKISGTFGTLEHPNDFKHLQTPQMEHYKPQTEHCIIINNLARNITFWPSSDSLPYTASQHLTPPHNTRHHKTQQDTLRKLDIHYILWYSGICSGVMTNAPAHKTPLTNVVTHY